MFRILDGRTHFYQWDLNQQLEVLNENVLEVHYSNYLSEEALVCEVKQQDGKRVVDVPNILLQETWDIKVYACCDCYTMDAIFYEVKPREKPYDYVYTETEIKSWTELEKRVEEIEKNGGGTGGGAVASVNSKTGDVVLNAEDVGAVKKTGDTMTGSLRMGDGSKWVPLYLNYKVNDIPYEGELALDENRVTLTKRTNGTAQNKLYLNDSNTTLMKPLTISSGGTEATTAQGARTNLDVYSKAEIDAAISEATKEGKYELIETITIEDDTVNTMERTAETNGTAYNFKKVYVEVATPKDTETKIGVIGLGDLYITYVTDMVPTYSEGKITKCFAEIEGGMLNVKAFSAHNIDYAQAGQNLNLYQRAFGGMMMDAITVVRVFLVSSKTFPIGTVIKIMGVRA